MITKKWSHGEAFYTTAGMSRTTDKPIKVSLGRHTYERYVREILRDERKVKIR